MAAGRDARSQRLRSIAAMNMVPGPGLQASGTRNSKRAKVNSNMDTDFRI
jgi:hypothetical protein